MKAAVLLAIAGLVAGSAAIAQPAGGPPSASMMQPGGPDGMMCPGMGRGMMGPGMMDRGMAGPGMLRVMLILMDSDGDGALSLEEVQAVHARMFHAMDADGNGRLTLEEIETFMHGAAPGSPGR